MLSEIDRFQQWLRRKAPHASTHIHYASDLRLFFKWADRSPSEIAPTDVDVFIEHSQQSGHSVSTINRRLAALSAFYQFLFLESDDAPKNPVVGRRHFVRQGERLPRDIEDPDLESFFTIVQSPRDRAMFLLMLRCGLRVGEIRNLSLEDLYLRSAPGALPRLWIRGKGGKQRVVYLSSQAKVVLDEWLKVRPTVEDQAVFLNRFNKRFSVTGIQLRLASYCHISGKWITCHQFRHTFGRHLAENHVPVSTIQRLLGHQRLRTTEVYLHISDSQVQSDFDAAMNELSKRLSLGDSEGGAK